MLLAATVVPWLTARQSGRAGIQARLSAVTVETRSRGRDASGRGAV